MYILGTSRKLKVMDSYTSSSDNLAFCCAENSLFTFHARTQTEKAASNDPITKEIVCEMIKQHESHIQSIIEQSLAKSQNKSTENGAHSANNENSNSESAYQFYANEQSELKYLLIRDELTKRQNKLDEVLLINEALQIKVKEYEFNSLQLPQPKLPPNVAHSSAQTVFVPIEPPRAKDFDESLCENDIQRPTLIDDTVNSDIGSDQHELVNSLKETIRKLKMDERNRIKKIEELTLKNVTLKLEICELKKEIKKYSSIWANDRYFNSLFLDASRVTISK